MRSGQSKLYSMKCGSKREVELAINANYTYTVIDPVGEAVDAGVLAVGVARPDQDFARRRRGGPLPLFSPHVNCALNTVVHPCILQLAGIFIDFKCFLKAIDI